MARAQRLVLVRFRAGAAGAAVPRARGGEVCLLGASAILGTACIPFLILALRAGQDKARVASGTVPSPGRAARRMLVPSVVAGVLGLAGFAAGSFDPRMKS